MKRALSFPLAVHGEGAGSEVRKRDSNWRYHLILTPP